MLAATFSTATRSLLLLLLLAEPFPSSSKTAWMRPESFRLAVGMPRSEVLSTLSAGGWTAKPGKSANQFFVDYSGDKSLTLEFRKDRLTSIRFELFSLLPEIEAAFEEEKAYLRKTLGTPRKLRSRKILLYDRVLPNVMAVLSNDPKSDHGKRGVGVMVVRYYDPVE